MATTLFAQAYAPYLALGVGGLGGRAAAAGCLDGFGEKLPWAACDTQSARLLATGLERKLRLGVPRVIRAEFIERCLDAEREQLCRLSRKKDVAILFGALDEPATIPLLAALGERLRREQLSVCSIGLDPLLPGMDVQADGLERIGFCLRVSAAAQVAELGSEIPAARLSRLGEELLCFAVEALLAALLGCDSAPGFTLDELHAFLRGGAIRSFVGGAQGGAAVTAALEQILAPVRSAGGHGVAVAVATGRELLLSEVCTLRSRLAETFGRDTPLLLGIGTDPSLGDEARCLLMCRPAASRNVLSLTPMNNEK